MLRGLASLLLFAVSPVFCNWDVWWNYNGVSGPNYWGLNSDWYMCRKGMRQSPINLDPSIMHYDPGLTTVRVDKQVVSGRVTNTGQSLVYKVEDDQTAINISGGPLAYKYQFQEMYFRWGEPNKPGSEHTVNQQGYTGELQIFGFNSYLYSNYSVAMKSTSGIVGISILIQELKEDDPPNRKSSFGFLAKHMDKLTYRYDSVKLPEFSLFEVLPNTEEYITYEGSTTTPGCWESVTWIVYNKPAYIHVREMDLFYRLSQSERSIETEPLLNNLRPRQNITNRILRTNIALPSQMTSDAECRDGVESVEYFSNNILNLASHITPYSP